MPRQISLLLFASAVLTATGCTGALEGLTREMDSPVHRPLGEVSDRYPLKLVRVPVREPDGTLVHLALHESAPSTSATPARRIVFLHGVLADARMWRYVRGGLAAEFHITTVDLLGCGASDHPAPAALGPTGYDPGSHARRVLEALRQQLSTDPPNSRITLVGHSLGGTVVLHMFADESLRSTYADVLARVDSALLLAPADVEIRTQMPEFADFVEAGDFTFCLADFFGELERRSVASSISGAVEPRRVIREEAARYVEVLRDPARRRAAQAMMRQTVPSNDGKPDHDAILRIVRGYSQMRIPVLIAWGERDVTLPLSIGYKLAAELPDAALRIVPDAMHSLAAEAPHAVIDMVRQAADGRPFPRYKNPPHASPR